MSWFDSKKFQNIAKTTLLQAQKQIDKVLDIKEEEILASSSSQATSIGTTVNEVKLPSSQDYDGSQQQQEQEPTTGTVVVESDNFFNNFLPQPLQVKTPSPSSNKTKQQLPAENNDVNFEEFLNQDSKKSNPIFSPATSLSSDLTTPTVSFIENNSELETESQTSLAKKSKKSKKNSSSSNRSLTPTNSCTKGSSKSSKVQPNSQAELEKNARLERVQSYVDTDGGNIVLNAASTSNDSALNDMVTLNPEPKDEMMLSINSSQYDAKTNSESTTAAAQPNVSVEQKSPTMEAFDTVMPDELISSEQVDSPVKEEENVVLEGKSTVSPNSTSSNISVEYSENQQDVVIKNKNITSLTDFVKVDGSSGNVSSNEEHETCASEILSDIEVLSLPSNSGQNRIPNLNQQQHHHQNKPHNHSIKPYSQLISSSNVMQILVKSPPPPPNNNNQQASKPLLKKVDQNETSQMEASAAQVLAAREAHIIKLNTQNVTLQEENDNLVNESEKFKHQMSERLGLAEKLNNELSGKLEKSSAERDQFKKACTDLQAEMAALRAQVREKDEQIEQFSQEGLKLSKQELNQSNIIKKLRAKEKEVESTMGTIKAELEKSRKEASELKKALDNKNESEKQSNETYRRLEKGAAILEKELTETKLAYEESMEKVKSLENTLQSSFKELAELHRVNAAKTSQINEATSSIESQYKEEIQTALDKERIVSGKKIDTLKWELECVRSDISRIEQQHAMREDMLRKEIADLQHQLRDTEMRNNELSQNISTATRPLLRQIENLQHSNSSQIESLESSEKNLIERLKETQASLCELVEKNRYDQEIILDLEQKASTAEAQNSILKSEKAKLSVEYQLAKTNLDSYENERNEKEAETRAQISSLTQKADKLAREKKNLEIQLDSEKSKLEHETKRFQALLSDMNKEKELQKKLFEKQQQQSQEQMAEQQQSTSQLSDASPPKLVSSMSRMSSGSFNFESSGRSDQLESIVSQTGNLNLLDSLQSKIRQKDGELSILQEKISKMERNRESMAKEMVSLTNQLEGIKDQLKEYPKLQENYNNLNMEYNALLQMYGEKTEETEELRMDLQDVKEMYKLQIEDLIKRAT